MDKNTDKNSKTFGMEKRGGSEKSEPKSQKPVQRPPSQIKEEKTKKNK